MAEPLRVATNRGDRFVPDEAEIHSLKVTLRGNLVTPGDPEYDEARRLWNGLIDKRPGVIVRCAGAADVTAAVTFARAHDLQVAVRGGGHNVAGHAVSEGGIVIDLSRMRDVRVDPEGRSVRASGGATIGDVDRETLPNGLAVPLGLVSETGIAGLTLHGGYGWLSRRYGLTADSLLSAEIVTADGRLRKASPEEHEDLFWAIRGGGGNFGVVTSFEYRLHPAGPKIWFAAPFYPLEGAEEGLRFFRDFIREAPDELGAIAVLWNSPGESPFPEEARGIPVLILAACYSGPFEDGERITRPLREIGTPVADLSGPMELFDLQHFFDPDYPKGRRYYWKSQYMPELSDAAIRLAVRQAAERPSPLTSIDIWALRGAVSRVDPGATAFAWRGAPFLYTIESNWDEPQATERNIAWTRKGFEEMRRLTGGGTYLNFPGFAEEGEDLVKRTFGDNYPRLKAVKAKYDPGNLFRGNFNIAP